MFNTYFSKKLVVVYWMLVYTYFIGANLKFPQTGKQQDIQDLLKKRNDSQPIGISLG
jgi:hypothetical protein